MSPRQLLQGTTQWPGKADFLVIASAGGPETRHLVSKEVLAALGPKGLLVNISRGSLVDEAALVDALETKAIAGAGLDLFEDEPQVPERLLALDNAVLKNLRNFLKPARSPSPCPETVRRGERRVKRVKPR